MSTQYTGQYSQKGDRIISSSTKKSYQFSRLNGSTAAGADLALKQMRIDDQAWFDAQVARNGGIPLTQRQVFDLVHGKPKAKAEPQVISQPVDDPKANPALKVLGELQAGLPERGKDQRSLKRAAVRALEQLAARKQAQIEHDERVELMMSDEGIQKALQHSAERLERMTLDPTYTADEVQEARALDAQLRSEATNEATHGDAAMNYFTAANAHSKAIMTRFKDAQRVQRERLELVNELVKKGELELPALEPEQPPAAPKNAMEAAQQRAAELGVPVQ